MYDIVKVYTNYVNRKGKFNLVSKYNRLLLLVNKYFCNQILFSKNEKCLQIMMNNLMNLMSIKN